VTPTPDDGVRLSSEAPWDEDERPSGPDPDRGRKYSPDEQAAGRHLVDVHDMLRAELVRLRDLIGRQKLSESWNARVDGYLRDGTTFKVNLALKGLPRFVAPLLKPAFEHLGNQAEAGLRKALNQL